MNNYNTLTSTLEIQATSRTQTPLEKNPFTVQYNLHDIDIVNDLKSNSLYISNMYLRNYNTSVVQTSFAQWYAFDINGLEIDNNQPKVMITSTKPDVQMHLSKFTYIPGKTNADVIQVVIRVVGTYINSGNKTLMSYLSLNPTTGILRQSRFCSTC